MDSRGKDVTGQSGREQGCGWSGRERDRGQLGEGRDYEQSGREQCCGRSGREQNWTVVERAELWVVGGGCRNVDNQEWIRTVERVGERTVDSRGEGVT